MFHDFILLVFAHMLTKASAGAAAYIIPSIPKKSSSILYPAISPPDQQCQYTTLTPCKTTDIHSQKGILRKIHRDIRCFL